MSFKKPFFLSLLILRIVEFEVIDISTFAKRMGLLFSKISRLLKFGWNLISAIKWSSREHTNLSRNIGVG